MSDTLVVNFFAGPGTGKSTTAAILYGKLKRMDVNCEMVREYAKDKVWAGEIDVLDDQIYLFAQTQRKMNILKGQVDVIISDGPLLLSLVYGEGQHESFRDLVYDTHMSFRNLNIFLNRTKKYNPYGRVQNEKEAHDLDVSIKGMLDDLHEKYTEWDAEEGNDREILEVVSNHISV